MGCFNTVYFGCPKCAARVEDQSKAGSCDFENKHLTKADLSDVACVAERSHICPGCGAKLKIRVQVLSTVEVDDGREDEEDED